MQESPELAFSTSSARASNTVRALLKQVCKHLSLAECDCQLYCDGVPLYEEQRLSQVSCEDPESYGPLQLRSSVPGRSPACSRTGVLQVPGCSSGVIQLTAKIQPSVALYHWQLFHFASLPNSAGLAFVWQAATEQYVRAFRDHGPQLPSFQNTAAVTATTRMLLPLHRPQDTVRAAPTLPMALKPVGPLLQLTQILLSQATSDPELESTAMSTSVVDVTQQESRCKGDPATTSPDDYIALLQTALLTLKLISLLSAVSSVTSSILAAVDTLWASLSLTSQTITKAQHNQGQMSHPSHPPNPPEPLSDVVTALTKLAMSELRRCLVKDGMSDEASLCCGLLTALLRLPLTKQACCSAVTIATAIKDPGSLLCLAPVHFAVHVFVACREHPLS